MSRSPQANKTQKEERAEACFYIRARRLPAQLAAARAKVIRLERAAIEIGLPDLVTARS